MSYDLQVFVQRQLPPAEIGELLASCGLTADDPSGAGGSEPSQTVLRGARRRYSFSLEPPVAIEAEDVPEEVTAVPSAGGQRQRRADVGRLVGIRGAPLLVVEAKHHAEHLLPVLAGGRTRRRGVAAAHRRRADGDSGPRLASCRIRSVEGRAAGPGRRQLPPVALDRVDQTPPSTSSGAGIAEQFDPPLTHAVSTGKSC